MPRAGSDDFMERLFGIFFAAFLAATILPFSSEAVLAAFYAGGGDAFTLWGVATLGNVLGAVINWLLGRYLLHWQARFRQISCVGPMPGFPATGCGLCCLPGCR